MNWLYFLNYRIFTFFILLFFIGIDTINAQKTELTNLQFEEFLIEDGFSSVNCIIRDKKGFMWFGGTHGLYRYDGYNFKIFTQTNINTISNDHVTCLFEDKEGIIWIGTMRGGLNRYDPKSETFTSYLNSKNKKLYNDSYITSITEDQQGRIWIGTFLNGITIFDKKYNDVRVLNTKTSNISSNSIFSITIGRESVWITSNSGILDCYKPNQTKFINYRFSNRKINSTRTGQRTTIDHKGNLWIATEGLGLFEFNTQSNTFRHYEYKNGKQGLSSNVITDIKEGEPGQIWMTTEGGGLNLLNTQTNEIISYKNNIYNPFSISNNSSYCLYIDIYKNLWLGMGDGSINRSFHSPFKTYKANSYNPDKNLSFNVVVSLSMTKDYLWIGTGGGGLDKLNFNDNTFTNFKNSPNSTNSLPSDIVMSLFSDSAGNLWVGNYKKGVSVKPKNSNSFSEPSVAIKNANNLSDNLVFDIDEDSFGNIWIATYDNALFKYNKFSHTYTHFSWQNGLNLTRILCDESNIWIGTLDKGVQIYNQKNNKFYSLNNFLGSKMPKIKSPVKDIYKDSKGLIWIATEGEGIYIINKLKKDYTRLNQNNGLPSNSIYGITEHTPGQFWFSSNKGISNYQQGRAVYNYNIKDGLPTNDFESGAIAKRGNTLYFGSKKGLVYFNPTDLNQEKDIFDIEISGFQIFNKEISAREEYEGKIVLDSSIVYDRAIKLPYFLDNISFRFSAPKYQKPYNISYQYKMEGLDNRWLETYASRPFASYANIPPGNYTFLVKGFNGKTTSNEIRIHLKVTPIWWQSSLAKLTYAIILIGLIYFIYLILRNRVRLKNQLAFEKYAHEKDEELYQSKINFFTTISHELRTSLTLILTPISELNNIDTSSNKVNNLVKGMHRNGQRLLNLINQILDFRKIDAGENYLNITEVELQVFFKEICIPFQQLAKEKNINFKIEISKDLHIGFLDANKVEIIVYNLLSNAFKYAKKEIVFSVKSEENNNKLQIKITDDGEGIPLEEQSAIFEKFYRANQKKMDITIGSGLGLAIVKNFIELHKGNIFLKSNTRETTFTVTLMIDKNFYPIEYVSENIETNKAEISELSIIHKETKHENILNKRNVLQEKLLLVEDNFELRTLIKSNLSSQYHVYEASNGKEALEIIFNIIPDIIISDIMMPEMNGLELCKAIKSDTKTSHIPIILLTARSTHHFRAEGYEYGADDYVTKPFDMQLLRVRIANLIELRKKIQEKFKGVLSLNPSDIAINNTEEQFLRKLMNIMEENISNAELTAPKLASELGMSHSVLFRKITALTGYNINDFIKSIRLKRACQLLRDSDYTISEISYITGFTNPKYFSTCFKTEYGETPSDYRQHQKYSKNN